MNYSYNKDREDFNLNQAISSSRNKSFFRIEYIDELTFKILTETLLTATAD